MTTLNGIPISWDSFIQGICARRNLISFNRLREEFTQEEAQLIIREEKMGANEDQSLTAHTRKNYKKKDNHDHNKKKDNKQNNFRKDPFNIRCYTCDEKGNFVRDGPNKKKRHHAHITKYCEPTNKRLIRDKDDSDEEDLLLSLLT